VSDTPTPPLFELHEATFRYRNTVALDKVSLTIESGSRVALLGANGCGKSTLLRILDGLYFAESGYLLFEGEEINEHYFQHDELAHYFRRRVGLVFQNPDVQLFCPTVFDELAFGPLHLGWPKEKIREAVEEALVHFHIEALRDRAPHHLSGGEKKRVAIASVLIMDPDVLLLDEPIAALDPRSQEHILELMRAWDGAGKTVVTATHDLDLLQETASHCVVLDRGRIVCSGAPGEVLADRALLQRANLIRQ
jgi:cobalt/nickel transport system ATP-binding protein